MRPTRETLTRDLDAARKKEDEALCELAKAAISAREAASLNNIAKANMYIQTMGYWDIRHTQLRHHRVGLEKKLL